MARTQAALRATTRGMRRAAPLQGVPPASAIPPPVRVLDRGEVLRRADVPAGGAIRRAGDAPRGEGGMAWTRAALRTATGSRATAREGWGTASADEPRGVASYATFPVARSGVEGGGDVRVRRGRAVAILILIPLIPLSTSLSLSLSLSHSLTLSPSLSLSSV